MSGSRASGRVPAADVEARIGLRIARLWASARASAYAPSPIAARMKVVVALTSPRSRAIAPGGRQVGRLDHRRAAAHARARRAAATRRSAISASSAPSWAARSALFAVTYGVPRSSVARAQSRGPVEATGQLDHHVGLQRLVGRDERNAVGRSSRLRFRTARPAS